MTVKRRLGTPLYGVRKAKKENPDADIVKKPANDNIKVEKAIGVGAEFVYCYYFPSQKKEGEPFPIKIGYAKRDPEARIRQSQSAMQDAPIIALLIRCVRSPQIEAGIHRELAKSKMNTFGTEWFLTTPEDIEQAFYRLDKPEGVSVGEQVLFHRTRLGLTQKMVAAMSSVMTKSVVSLENEREVELSTVEAVASALGMRLMLVPRDQTIDLSQTPLQPPDSPTEVSA